MLFISVICWVWMHHVVQALMKKKDPKAVRQMEENFGEAIRRRPREILLEKKLGSLIQPLLYSGNESYNKSLKGFLETHQETQGNTQKYIDGGLKAETFAGLEIRIAKNEIALEINRCPQLNLGIERSYYTGFDYISKVFEHALF